MRSARVTGPLRLRHEFDLPEVAVRFFIRARREVQHIRRTGRGTIAKPDAPQAVDDERFSILPQLSLMMELAVAIEAEGVDLAIAKIPDEKTPAEAPEGRRIGG